MDALLENQNLKITVVWYGKDNIKTQNRKIEERGQLWEFREKTGPGPQRRVGADVAKISGQSLWEAGVENLKSEGSLRKVINKGVFFLWLFTMHPISALLHDTGSLRNWRTSLWGAQRALDCSWNSLQPPYPLRRHHTILHQCFFFFLTYLSVAAASFFTHTENGEMTWWLFFLQILPRSHVKLLNKRKRLRSNWALGNFSWKALLRLWSLETFALTQVQHFHGIPWYRSYLITKWEEFVA